MTLSLLPHLLALASSAVLALPPAQDATARDVAQQSIDAEQRDRLADAERMVSEAERQLELRDDVARAALLLAAAEPALTGPQKLPAAAPLLPRATALAAKLSRAAGSETFDPETRAALARLLASQSAPPQMQGSQPSSSTGLRAAVEDALRRNDTAAIARLDVHALSAFEAILASSERRDLHDRALDVFFELHPGRTASALRARLANDTLDVSPHSVVRAVGDMLRDERTWFAVSDAPPRRYAWTVPELSLLVEDLLADARTRDGAVAILEPALRRNALTQAMVGSVGGMIESEDLALAQRTFRLLEKTPPSPDELRVLEHGLDSPHPVIRLRSVQALREHVPSAPFLVKSGDPDPAVRRAVAEGLAAREALYIDVQPGGSSTWAPRIPVSYATVFPEETRDAFARLLNDPDASVRAAAIAALPNAPDVVPADAVAQLARDGSPGERELLLQARLPQAVHARVVAELARHVADATPRLVAALARMRPLEDVLPLLELHWADVLALDFDADLAQAVMSSGPVLESLVGWTVAHGEAPHLLRLEELLRFVANEGTVARALPDDLLVAWIRKLDATPRADARVGWSAARLISAASGRPEVAVRILSDAEADLDLRLAAAQFAARRDDAEFRGALRELMSVLDDRPSAPTQDESGKIQSIGTSLPLATRNSTVAAFVADGELALPWVAPLASSIQYKDPGAREAAAAVLARWSGDTDALVSAATTALGFAEQWPELTTDELLLRALRNPFTAENAMRVMVARREARHVPVLRDALAASTLTGNTRVRVAQSAVQGLLAIGNDAAVDALLEGLGHDSEVVRAACADALDQIQRTRERREAWRARAEAGGTLETALADLRPLLAHEDVTIRAEAVRSLGTLGSPLDIPRLIPLLTDKEAKVREAARAALDRLHAIDAPAAKPAKDAEAAKD